MHSKVITLILIGFLAMGAIAARADVARDTQKAQTPPAKMSDAALASYISGRLEPLLKDSGYAVSQECDASGCSVVVQ